jgi:hypothetical protein
MGAGTFYPTTWAGLLACYAAGVPFYRTMLVGNLLFVPLVAFGALAVRERHRLTLNRPAFDEPSASA